MKASFSLVQDRIREAYREQGREGRKPTFPEFLRFLVSSWHFYHGLCLKGTLWSWRRHSDGDWLTPQASTWTDMSAFFSFLDSLKLSSVVLTIDIVPYFREGTFCVACEWPICGPIWAYLAMFGSFWRYCDHTNFWVSVSRPSVLTLFILTPFTDQSTMIK